MLIKKQYNKSMLLEIYKDQKVQQCFLLSKKQNKKQKNKKEEKHFRFFTRNGESIVVLFGFNIMLV